MHIPFPKSLSSSQLFFWLVTLILGMLLVLVAFVMESRDYRGRTIKANLADTATEGIGSLKALVRSGARKEAELIADIQKTVAETKKLEAESIANVKKTIAEAKKLEAEARKIETERLIAIEVNNRKKLRCPQQGLKINEPQKELKQSVFSGKLVIKEADGKFVFLMLD